MNRRLALRNLAALAAASALPAGVKASDDAIAHGPVRRLRKIATEEAFTIPEIADAFRSVIKKSYADSVRSGYIRQSCALLRSLWKRPIAYLGPSERGQINLNNIANQRTIWCVPGSIRWTMQST